MLCLCGHGGEIGYSGRSLFISLRVISSLVLVFCYEGALRAGIEASYGEGGGEAVVVGVDSV